jgi:hypothetical protein
VIPLPPGNSDEEILETLGEMDPLIWTMHCRRLKNYPCVFDVNRVIQKPEFQLLTPKERGRWLTRHRPFLIQPLRDESVYKVYEKGRQVGVSELSLTEELFFLKKNDNTKWIRTFPREKQLLDFATTRIKPAFKETPRMAKLLGVPDQVTTKKIGNSYLLLRSAWESDLGEGVDADGVTFDEKDRMKQGIEVAFKESLSSSRFGWMREVSTPTLPGRGVDASYQKSCQYEWHVRCVKCGERQIIDYPDNVVQMKDIPLGTVELEDGTYEFRCRKQDCRGELDRTRGEWIAKYPSRKYIAGYWMPQSICMWHSATSVMQRKIEYKFAQIWLNYVWGKPGGGDSILLTHQDFELVCAGYTMFSQRPTKGYQRVVGGIDWGSENWVVVLGQADNGLKYLLAAACFEDDEKEPLMSARRIEQFLAPFDCDLIVADAGYGKDRNSYMRKRYIDKFYACSYNPSDQRSRTFKPVWSEKGARVLVDRTIALKDMCRAFKEHEIGLPDLDSRIMQIFEKHLTALTVMKIEEDGEVFEVVENTGPDHLAHALAYAKLGLEKDEEDGFGDLGM